MLTVMSNIAETASEQRYNSMRTSNTSVLTGISILLDVELENEAYNVGGCTSYLLYSLARLSQTT